MNINRETILETEIPVVKVTDLFMSLLSWRKIIVNQK